jgi:hypothetical protein
VFSIEVSQIFNSVAYFVMEFRELSDGEWGVIAVFLPLKPKRCWRALSDDGSLINGILYVITAVYQLGCKFKVF